MLCPWELNDTSCKHEDELDKELRGQPSGIAKTCLECRVWRGHIKKYRELKNGMDKNSRTVTKAL